MAVALVAGAATMTGCDDDFDRPPVIVPEATIEANTTIFELKEKYWQGTTSDFMTTIGTTDSGEHVIIGGRVVSSDEEGNVYQRIVLEDETSSIFVRIYSTKLFESYQYGQEVRIDVTGLLIGTYRGLMMIGVDYNGSVGGMDLDVFQQRAQVNGLPDKAAIPQYVTTISDIKSYLTDQTQLMTWQSRLITLENVQFVGGGSEMFGTPGAANYTTRQLKDAEGNTLDISTSNRCEFVNLLMPAGTGTVNAILSYYGSNWQLVFSDPLTDCTGFTWVDTPTTPEVPDTPTGSVLYSALGETDATIDWDIDAATGVWSWKEYSGKHYLNASAYGNDAAIGATTYAFSPVIDLTAAKSAKMTFDHAAKFQTTLRTLCSAVVREDGASSWTELVIPTWPEAGSWTFVSAGEIDLSAYAGKKIQVGFKYGSSTDGADTWEIKNLKITE